MEIKLNNYRISIVIPVYNVEDYFSQCVDSIINQTYQYLEIILVDDGSSDSCPQICDEYALKDDRIKVIHKKNGGLSDARNAGLKICTGDFISFIDSDDIVAIDFCEKLLQSIIKNKADIVECDFHKFKTDLDLPKEVVTANATIEVFETEVALELLMKGYLNQIVWNKMYRKEVLNGYIFPINKINEDEFWTYKVFGNSKKIVKISDALYFYRQQAASIMGKKYSLKRLDGLQALEERIIYVKQKFPQLENLAIKYFCFGSMFHYQMINEHPKIDPHKAVRKQISKKVKSYNQLSLVKNWQWKTVFWYYLFVVSPNTYIRFKTWNDSRIASVNKVN